VSNVPTSAPPFLGVFLNFWFSTITPPASPSTYQVLSLARAGVAKAVVAIANPRTSLRIMLSPFRKIEPPISSRFIDINLPAQAGILPSCCEKAAIPGLC
jgi:hypothetical protein